MPHTFTLSYGGGFLLELSAQLLRMGKVSVVVKSRSFFTVCEM